MQNREAMVKANMNHLSARSSWYGAFFGQFIQSYDSRTISTDVFPIQALDTCDFAL